MRKLIFIFFVIVPAISLATFSIEDPFHGTRLNEQLEPVSTVDSSDIPKIYQSRNKFIFQTKKGWLASNLKRFSKKEGWQIKWRAKRNYQLLLSTEIAGETFPNAVNELLSHYPLRASFNQREKIMTIYDQPMK